MKKIVIITAKLIEQSEAYEGKNNVDIQKEILAEMPVIPYVARIEKVTVLDAEG